MFFAFTFVVPCFTIEIQNDVHVDMETNKQSNPTHIYTELAKVKT